MSNIHFLATGCQNFGRLNRRLSGVLIRSVFIADKKGGREVYQSLLIFTELFQHNLIKVSYLTACYLYQVMMTLHSLNDVANDARSHKNKKNYIIITSLKSVQQWVN